MSPLFWIAIIIAAVILLLVSTRGSQRRDNLRMFASNRDWRFEPRLTNWRSLGFHELPLCRRGYGRRCDNVTHVDIPEARRAILCDYVYFTQAGQYAQSVRQTVLFAEVPDAGFPTFALAPETIFHRIGEWFGWTDIDFPTHADFSHNYRLVGDDEAAARAVFTPAVIEFIERQPTPRLHVESASGWVAIYRHFRTVPTDETAEFLADAQQLLRALHDARG